MKGGTLHHNTITIYNKRIRSYETGWWRREVVMKGSDDEGKCWRWESLMKEGNGDEGEWWGREVGTMGGGDDGKWWGREVVTKGSGDEAEWWGREVGTMGGGDDGKWWGREVVTKGSGDEAEWWGREVGTMGGGDDGKWWGREMVTKGSGEEGKWWRRGVVTMGSGDVVLEAVCVVLCISWICGCRSHWNGCMNVARAKLWGGSRSTKPCVFPCKVAAAGDERYLVCAAVAAAVGLAFFLLPQCNGGLKLLWVCLCVRS